MMVLAGRRSAADGTLRAVRVAVLIKQVPRFEDMALGPDGRLQREGLELEMNPYCRRAVSKGAELAQASGGLFDISALRKSL